MTRVGFIGLGMMGTPMAQRLLAAGCSLTIQDANPAREEALLALQPAVRRAAGPGDFSGCSCIFTMLPDSEIVDRVVLALLPHLAPGSTVVDMSSADPARTRLLGERLKDAHVDLLDAPVSGGVKKAAVGKLAIMVGGAADVLARVKPLLKAMGEAITHVGPIGAGHAAKALNNYVSAAALIATAEAIHVAAAFGIDREVLVEVLDASTGRNNTTQNKARQFMLNGAFDSGFSLALQAKDVAIAASLGRRLEMPMRLAEQVDEITRAAARSLGPTADHTELYRHLGQR